MRGIIDLLFKKNLGGQGPVILATQEVEIRRILVQSQLCATSKNPSQKKRKSGSSGKREHLLIKHLDLSSTYNANPHENKKRNWVIRIIVLVLLCLFKVFSE
jgi:hypothetical protein